MIYALIFMMGCIMGSFLTCQGERMATGRDWIRGHSVCEDCGHVLKGRDLIPVISYLCGGGKCRYCKSKIPVTALLGEVLCGYMYVRIYTVYGISLLCLEMVILVSLLYSLSIVDYRTMEIPDGFIIAGCLTRIVCEGIEKGLQLSWIQRDLLGAFVVPCVLLVVSAILDKRLGTESLGGGDIKLFFIDRGRRASVNE